MGDNSKILEDISTLTQICHSNSDGPTLKIEETEIKNKLVEYDEEIEEIKALDADDSYDTSAEMADRNIEIITKKVIQTTNNELKNKNLEMDSLKEKEAEYSNSLYGLKRTRISYEKYIASLKDRLTAATEDSITERYNNIISSTESKMIKQDERIKEMEEKHEEIQNAMDKLHEEITSLESRLETKKTLLAEAQNNLQNKELYIDKAKKEKSTKRITEIEDKKEDLNKRLDEISKDPKYLEMKIKEIISDGNDNFEARNYIVELLTLASKVPYADQYVDKRMEEELLEATQQRDTFAGEIDSKTYDIMESVSPEQIRVEFLNNRISYWQSEIKKLEEKVSRIDKDETFHYAEKNSILDELIAKLKEETLDFKTRYEKESDSNLSNKAILKITYEEKKADLAAAEEISSKFRKNEAEDVEEAGRIVKQEIEELNRKVREAEDEIYKIKERLDNRKSGNKDLSAKNRDREKLEKLAQVVIDIKHRRQFADRAFDIAKRLEFNLGMKLVDAVYTDEDQERLNKEVMIPIEEPKVEEPVVMESEPVSEEVVVEEAVAEEPVAEAPVAVEEPEVTVEEQPVEETVEPSPEMTVEEAINEMPSEEVPTEEQTTEEVVPEAEIPVTEVTEEVHATEIPVESTEEAVPTEETAEISVSEEAVAVDTPEVTEENPVVDPVEASDAVIPSIEAPVAESVVAEEVSEEPVAEVQSIEIPAVEEQSAIEEANGAIPEVTVDPETPVDFSIPELTPSTEENMEPAPAMEINIPDEAPVPEVEIPNTEEVAVDLPPLPDISSDDTTSIPVIPIAEPSTDDNFTFNAESSANDINLEMSPFSGADSTTDTTSEESAE